MKTKLLLLTFMSVTFSTSAFSDIVMPQRNIQNQDPRTQYSWDQGSPTLIRSTMGCASANICVGDYVASVPGYTGSVVIGKGHAFCNSIGNNCPTAQDCVADTQLNFNNSPNVMRRGQYNGQAPMNQPSSGYGN